MLDLFNHEIKDFISQHTTAVIATVDSEGQPHTSTIYFSYEEKDKIYFLTKDRTTKSQNLEANNKVAITVLDKNQAIAVNITGTAKAVEDIAKRDSVMQSVLKISHDNQADYAPIVKLHKGGFKVFMLTPTQAKMTDFTKPMGEVKEKLKNF